MNHPFFDAVAFPWHLPQATDLHRALYQAIGDQQRIDLLCKKCLEDINLTKPASSENLWKEALEKLTNAGSLKELCNQLLEDARVKAIHATVKAVFDSQPQAKENLTPIQSKEWYQDSRRRLQGLAQEELEESDVTRKFILRCNELPETTIAETLAKTIFDSDRPMSYLRKCASRKRLKNKLTEDDRKELGTCIYRLIDFVAPVCFTVEDLHAMEPHVNRKEGSYSRVSTNAKAIAVSMVAGIKGVCADLNSYPSWEQFRLDDLPDSRELVSHVPPPPESGRRPSEAENPIAALVAVLAVAVHPEQPTLEYVKAKLASLAEYDKVYLVVLFNTMPASSYLDTLHRTFPELVLLVAGPRPQVADAAPAADVSLHVDITDLRKEFGPQQSGNMTA